MALPKLGGAVTILIPARPSVPDETTYVDRGSVSWVYNLCVFADVKIKLGSETLFAADEGTRWIHGHHNRDSDEVKALLVAYALTREDASPQATGPTGATGPVGPTRPPWEP